MTNKDTPNDYEVRVVVRMGGWSVQYRDNTGQVRDKFFSDERKRDRFVESLNAAPRGYYH